MVLGTMYIFVSDMEKSMRFYKEYMPYWYFNIVDPDGNVLEVTGKYK